MFARLFLAAALIAGSALPAAARAVTDCPNANTPFTAGSPLIDLMLSPAARAILDAEAPGKFSRLPSRFAGTTPPTFAAIITLREAAGFVGVKPEEVATIDAALRGLRVTQADRRARCARYDNDKPKFSLPADRPRLLLFEKINGFKDVPSVNAAHAAIVAMAERKGWAVAVTEKGGAFNAKTLGQFDAVIWNNISGDVLTLSQRRAMQAYIERGGGFVAMHGSAGDPNYFWDWYADTLIGTRFKGHPMAPQFQPARIVVEDARHPAAQGLPGEWTMTDEWYSFKTNPRASGARVIATLDEASYSPKGMMGMDLKMGDHPIAWTKCVGRGRMFYSAIGHRPETYGEPNHVTLLEGAIGWAAGAKVDCGGGER